MVSYYVYLLDVFTHFFAFQIFYNFLPKIGNTTKTLMMKIILNFHEYKCAAKCTYCMKCCYDFEFRMNLEEKIK